MAYVPDPTNANTPLDTDNIGTVTPPELRALKQHIINKFNELEGLITAAEGRVNNSMNSYTDGLEEEIEGLATDVSTKLNPHLINTDNPHGVTKIQVGLGNVLNYGITNDPTSTASNLYASAMAVQELYLIANDAKNTLNSINANIQTITNNVTSANSTANSLSNQINTINQRVPSGLLYRVSRMTSGTYSNPAGTGDSYLLLEAYDPNFTGNVLKVLTSGQSYTLASPYISMSIFKAA